MRETHRLAVLQLQQTLDAAAAFTIQPKVSKRGTKSVAVHYFFGKISY